MKYSINGKPATWEEVAKTIIIGGLIPPKKYLKEFRRQQKIAAQITQNLKHENRIP